MLVALSIKPWLVVLFRRGFIFLVHAQLAGDCASVTHPLWQGPSQIREHIYIAHNSL